MLCKARQGDFPEREALDLVALVVDKYSNFCLGSKGPPKKDVVPWPTQKPMPGLCPPCKTHPGFHCPETPSALLAATVPAGPAFTPFARALGPIGV